MTFDSPWQTVVAFAALAVWSWWLIRPPTPDSPRWLLFIVWGASLWYAASSLTYIDGLPKGTASGFNFAARIFLLVMGIGVPAIVGLQHRRELRNR